MYFIREKHLKFTVLFVCLLLSCGRGNSQALGESEDQLSPNSMNLGDIAPIAAPTPALPPIDLDIDDVAPLLSSSNIAYAGAPLNNISAIASSVNLSPPSQIQDAYNRPVSNAFVFNDTNNPVVTSNVFRTSCTINLRGNSDGTGLSLASVICTGPGVPIKITGSEEVHQFSQDFEGVEYTAGYGQSDTILAFRNVSGVVLLNSEMIGTSSGAIEISDSNMQIVGGLFANNSNQDSGVINISRDSSVLVDSTTFQGNEATSAGALRLQNATVAVTNCSFIQNVNMRSDGGSITSIYSRLTVIGSAFLGNLGIQGGAIYVEGGELNLNSTSLVQNRATSLGGGIYQTSSKLRVSNSNFSNNAAGTLGGALLTDLTDFVIVESIFELNRAQSQGGAVYQSNCTGNFRSSTLRNNTASNGGALYQDGCTGNITLCLFQTNNASQTGGAIAQSRATITVLNSTFTSNYASQLGGALAQSTGSSSISGCIFRANKAKTGGAVFRTAISGNIVSCSFYSNSSDEGGGALYINNSKGNITSCLFSGNTSSQGSSILLNASSPRVTGCLFDNSRDAGSAIFANSASSTGG